MPDARKHLDVLANEWSGCTRCDLGVRRAEVNGAFVFGEGSRGGLMLIGEGPGAHEEQEGRPFIGKSGMLIRHILDIAGVADHYITNTVACRSCAPAFDSIGRPLVFKDRRTGQDVSRINDEPPKPAQVEACKPRLLEQIYIVDPILIVTLGGGAAAALTGKSVTITRDRGTFQEVEIPGAWQLPILTDKKKQWVRKVGGQIVAPVRQSTVRYLTFLTIHPAYALRYVRDKRHGNVFTAFVLDMQTAINTYNRYIRQLIGMESTDVLLNPEEIEEYAADL